MEDLFVEQFSAADKRPCSMSLTVFKIYMLKC